jgi:hypothetical protein
MPMLGTVMTRPAIAARRDPYAATVERVGHQGAHGDRAEHRRADGQRVAAAGRERQRHDRDGDQVQRRRALDDVVGERRPEHEPDPGAEQRQGQHPVGGFAQAWMRLHGATVAVVDASRIGRES